MWNESIEQIKDRDLPVPVGEENRPSFFCGSYRNWKILFIKSVCTEYNVGNGKEKSLIGSKIIKGVSFDGFDYLSVEIIYGAFSIF